MQQIHLLVFLLLVLSTTLTAQEHIRITDEKSGKTMLVGSFTPDAFQDTAFSEWYNNEYESYAVYEKILDTLKQLPQDYTIHIVLGTWCPDSRREVPRFLKLLDLLNYDYQNLSITAVDRSKRTLSNIDELNIEFVPTFIFYRGGEEAGRIIESPSASLEEDFLYIVR